jgi:hypothetical protein
MDGFLRAPGAAGQCRLQAAVDAARAAEGQRTALRFEVRRGCVVRVVCDHHIAYKPAKTHARTEPYRLARVAYSTVLTGRPAQGESGVPPSIECMITHVGQSRDVPASLIVCVMPPPRTSRGCDPIAFG